MGDYKLHLSNHTTADPTVTFSYSFSFLKLFFIFFGFKKNSTIIIIGVKVVGNQFDRQTLLRLTNTRESQFLLVNCEGEEKARSS